MIIETVSGVQIDSVLVQNYFQNLIGLFFKILPLYENNEQSLKTYMENLRDELEGCSGIVAALQEDAQFFSLISTLQFLINRVDDGLCTNDKIRRKVFGAISVCKKLSQRYGTEGEHERME